MQQRRQLEISTEIRASYQRLPFQRFWTWLTGKALPVKPCQVSRRRG